MMFGFDFLEFCNLAGYLLRANEEQWKFVDIINALEVKGREILT